MTGDKWIDGKPIYTKVIDFGTVPSNSKKSVNHGITGLDTVITLRGFKKNSDMTSSPLPYAATGSVHSICLYMESTTQVSIQTATSFAGNVWIIMEYTKN